MTVPNEELAPLFDAVLADPDNDAPRLELAHYLDERGDKRGEYIRLSIELEKFEADDPARLALQARCDALPRFGLFTSAINDLNIPLQIGWHRGFVESFDCHVPHFVAHADLLFRNAPIRMYQPIAPQGWAAILAQCPALARLRTLRIDNCFADDARIVLASPHLANLREIRIHWHLETAAAVDALADATKNLTALRSIAISGFYNMAASRALARFVKQRRFEHVRVHGAGGSSVTIADLYGQLGNVLQDPRPTLPVVFRFGKLQFDGHNVDAKFVRAAIDSGEYRRATTVVLNGVRIGDDGIEHLARSGAFPNLVDLQISGTGITDRGAFALADGSGLDKLEVIDLGDVPREADHIGARDGSGVSDDGVRALALSPRLPAIREIHRGKEYRHSFDGHEGRESMPIQRPDGRVVESVIFHSIWP